MCPFACIDHKCWAAFSQVWYADNEYEILDARFVLKLMTSTSWRQQLVALQGHVIPHRVEYGVYRASEDVCVFLVFSDRRHRF